MSECDCFTLECPAPLAHPQWQGPDGLICPHDCPRDEHGAQHLVRGSLGHWWPPSKERAAPL